MPSTLYGIYNTQRALSLNQSAIDIINNNVANMNTKGYSKQSLQISQLNNLSSCGTPQDVVQNGMGAVIDGVARNRDAYLDFSFRKENTDLNYYKEYSDNAVQMENTVNELGDSGLSKSLNDFYNGLSQLAANPNDYVTRSTVIQSAISLTTKFNNTYSGLQNLRTSIVGDVNNPDTLNESKLSISIDDLNNKLSTIADLNNKINLSSAQGIIPNNLLDQRDLLLDDVSKYIPVSITNEKNNTVTISLGSIDLVSGKDRTGLFEIKAGDVNNPSVVQIKNEGGSVLSKNAYSLISSGQIGAMLQLGGSDTDKLTVKGMIESLNTLAGEFSNAVNTIQTNGRYIDNTVSPHELSNNTPEDFFVDSDLSGVITAGNITVNNTLINNPYQIAAAGLSSNTNETGDGSNALLMSQVGSQNIVGIGGTTTQEFITNLIGKIGTQSKNIQDSCDVKDSILQQVTQKRDSITGVNLDEELTDLVKFQKAYQASARVMTTINQTLDTIINMLG